MNLWRECVTTGTSGEDSTVVGRSVPVSPGDYRQSYLSQGKVHKSRLGQESRVGLGARHPVDGGPSRTEGRKKADVLQLCIRYEKKRHLSNRKEDA